MGLYIKSIYFKYIELFFLLLESHLDQAIFKQWEQENKRFIPSNACKEVEKKTEDKNLVIVGQSGSGKTAIIQHVALKYMEKRWIVKPVKDIEDFATVLLNGNDFKNTLFVFNDPLGKESLDEILYEKWQRYAKALSANLKNAKLLMSCRKHIFSDKKVKGLFCDVLDIVLDIVDIDIEQNKLNKDEKRNILKSYNIDEKLSEEDCAEIVEIEDYFPLLCKLYSKKK